MACVVRRTGGRLSRIPDGLWSYTQGCDTALEHKAFAMTTTCTINRCRRPATERYVGLDLCDKCLAKAHAINADRNAKWERGEQDTGRRNMSAILEEMKR